MSIENLVALAEERAKRKKKRNEGGGGSGTPSGRGEDDKRPTIRLAAGEMRTRVADESEDALIEAGVDLFKQGNRVVRVRWDLIKVSGGDTGKVLRLGDVPDHAILEAFEKHAYYEKFDGRSEEWVPANCPKETAAAYLSRDGAWGLRYVLGIVNTPIMRADGSILATPGYDETTALFYDPAGVEYPAIPENPTKEDALEAMKVLKAPLAHFPFVLPSGMSVAISSLMTAVLRRSMETAPLHAYDAPLAGAGKTKLANMAAILATGERAAVTNTGKDRSHGDSELEKRLGASLLAGDAVLLIDNVEGSLGNEMLNSILTETRYRFRPLGSSKQVEVALTTFYIANGNNITILGDMTRRVLLARLDPKVERPELLQFEFDPVDYVRANRGKLVAAILTIARAWRLSGEKGEGKLGSFEGWSRMIRDPLVWLGEPDPLDVMEEVRKGDPRLAKLRAVIGAWAAAFGDTGKTLAQVVAKAQERDGEAGRYVNPELRDALLAITSGGEQAPINAEKLAWWLRKNSDRYVEGARFVRGDDGTKTAIWVLEGATAALSTREPGDEDTLF